MELPAFVGPSYTSTSPLADGERTVNFYPESIEAPGATTKMALYPTPGLTAFTTLPLSPVRGIFGQQGECYAVGGPGLYAVTSTGGVTALGTVAIDANQATLTTNGDGGRQLFVTSGGTGYVLDLDTLVLTAVVSSVTMGAMLDGYFLALDAATSTLKRSDLFDGLTWDPLQVAQRSTASDPWRSLIVVGRNIWLLGEFTSELWYNSGDTFPFAPFPGALVQTGIAAAFSAQQIGTSVIWLAQSRDGARTVVKAEGITAKKVSTYAVDRALAAYDDVSDADAFIYEERGHTFYVLNFPSANATWVYDDTEGQWHERGDWDIPLSRYDVDRPGCHAYIFDRHLVGDRETGAIYTQSVDTSTNADGVGLRRLRRTPGIQSEQTPQTFHALRLFVEPGVGLSTGQGSDPLVSLRYSDDGGMNFGNEIFRSVGAIGKYKNIVEWNRLGQSRYPRVWEVVMTDPVPWRILGAWVNPSRMGA